MSWTELIDAYWARWALANSGRSGRIRLERPESPEDELLADAPFRVDEVVLADADQGLELILALVRTAPDDDALAYLAAGPLQELYVAYPERVVVLKDLAAESGDVRLQRALDPGALG